jgi:hypothetical protein
MVFVEKAETWKRMKGCRNPSGEIGLAARVLLSFFSFSFQGIITESTDGSIHILITGVPNKYEEKNFLLIFTECLL